MPDIEYRKVACPTPMNLVSVWRKWDKFRERKVISLVRRKKVLADLRVLPLLNRNIVDMLIILIIVGLTHRIIHSCIWNYNMSKQRITLQRIFKTYFFRALNGRSFTIFWIKFSLRSGILVRRDGRKYDPHRTLFVFFLLFSQEFFSTKNKRSLRH